MKRYDLGWQYDPDPFMDRRCQPERQLVEARNGEWCRASEVDAALSARDARIAELERHLAACKAECEAWRAFDGTLSSENFATLDARRGDVDAARAATDAAGGVA